MANKLKPLSPIEENYVSRKEMAAIIGCDVLTVDRYVRLGMPHKTDDREIRSFPVSKCVQWLVEKKVKDSLKQSSPEDLSAAKSRRESALAEMAEITLQEKKGTIVTIPDANNEMEKRLKVVDGVMKAIPAKYVELFVGLNDRIEAQNQLQTLIDNVYNDIQRNLDDLT